MLPTDASAEAAAEIVDQLKIAVLVPCYNEEAAIGKVVADFRAELPNAGIYVYDNNSKDRTVEVATKAGAIVRRETHQGKGRVVRRMFMDVDADIYVMVDGDATYDAPSVHEMIALLVNDRLDMVCAVRVDREEAAYRLGHRAGNKLLTGFVANVFGHSFNDMLSGYRVFTRRFVKSFPVLSGGFEIETELTVHALELELPVGEVKTPYYSRPEGSTSKLSTYARWLAHSADHAEALPLGTSAAVLQRHRYHAGFDVHRPRDPAADHLCAGRHRAAPADRRAVDRPDSAGLARRSPAVSCSIR